MPTYLLIARGRIIGSVIFQRVLGLFEGGRGVMVIVAGCGHDDTSSNPGRAWLHFT